MVTAAVPVAAPAVVMMIWVLLAVTAGAEPDRDGMLVAVAVKVAVPMK